MYNQRHAKQILGKPSKFFHLCIFTCIKLILLLVYSSGCLLILLSYLSVTIVNIQTKQNKGLYVVNCEHPGHPFT